ncbi:MAG: hypothetical protein MR332_10865 [Fusicatenibacter sp.]|nr:hypothetical protein [Fusicatenibacter sp.]
MLKTCIKHEWKASWKTMTLLNGAALLMGGIGAIGMAAANHIHLPSPVVFLYFLVYVILLISAVFATNFLMIQRYYKSLFSDEGYLTNVLPVTAHAQILSRMLVFAAWFLIDLFCVIGSIFILLLPLYASAVPKVNWSEFFSVYEELSRSLGFANGAAMLIYVIIFCICSIFFAILEYYFSISLGSLFSSHRVLAAVAIYIGFNTLMQFISSFVMVGTATKFYSEAHTEIDGISVTYQIASGVHNALLVTLAITILLAIAFYFVSHYVLSKKLNLQ